MGKPRQSRPKGGRPHGRRGKSGGIGPGPAYRPNPNTGGSTHKKSSSVEGTPIMTLVYGVGAFVVLTVGGVSTFLLHGYGVL